MTDLFAKYRDPKVIAQFQSFVERLSSCCWKHPETDWPVSQVSAVFAWVESENDGPSGGALVQFSDGRYGTFEESQDYTGHG